MKDSNHKDSPPKTESPVSEDLPEKLSQCFADEIQRFSMEIESLATSFPQIMGLAYAMRKNANDRFSTFLEEKAVGKTTNDDKSITFKLQGDAATESRRLQRKLQSTQTAFELLHRSFLTSMVSQYDSFLGRLIRLVFFTKPEILNGSEKQMSFAELTQFKSMDEARNFIVEKEVESIIRKSHSDHFVWFEKALGIPLRTDLAAWPRFIELTERRNLFVHCDGIVSSQYMTACTQHKAELDKSVTVGTQLDVTRKYLEDSARCISEIGIKLAQVTWRKLLPAEVGPADLHLNVLCYELLVRSEYELAKTLLDFACSKAVKHASDEMRRFLILNRAQAYKWTSDQPQCLQIVDGEDWSACSERLKIAVAVLRDDFLTASKLMTIIGKDEQSLKSYKEWPIFREFRKAKEFLDAFQSIYGEPFSIQTTANQDPGGKISTN